MLICPTLPSNRLIGRKERKKGVPLFDFVNSELNVQSQYHMSFYSSKTFTSLKEKEKSCYLFKDLPLLPTPKYFPTSFLLYITSIVISFHIVLVN